MKNPIHPTLKTEIIPLLLIVVSLIASVYFYLNFPERVPDHWNIKGEVDGYCSKGSGAFFLPIIYIGFYPLMLFIPMIDPKKERYEQFRKPYHMIKNSVIVFMTIIYFYTGLAGLGYHLFSINIILSLGLGILFIVIGNYMGKVKSNWFCGIRTPWTLSNEEVWNKTHRLGGKVFVIMGLIMLSGMFLPVEIFFIIVIISAIFGSLIPVVYSYWLYRRITK